MNYFYPISAFTLLIIVVFSLFLPHYTTLTDGMHDDTFSYISQYPNPDQSGGFFGGGYYTTFNGFGSLNSLLNVFLSLITTLLLLSPRLTKKMLTAPLIIFAILFVFNILEGVTAPYLLSDPDKLLSGYFILRICEIGIFCLVSSKAGKNNSSTLSRTNLLDDNSTNL